MKLSELQKNKKLMLAILSAVLVVAITMNIRTFGISIVSEKMIAGKQAEIKMLEIKLKNIEAEYKFEEDKIWNLNALLRNFWQPKFDGDGMEAFKPLVEKLAKESKITFSFIGNVRRNGGTGLVSYTLPISGSAPFSVLLPFMKKIDKNCPHMNWQSLTLSLNRGNSTQIDFNGNIRVFCLENPAMIELLEKVTKPKKLSKSSKPESANSKQTPKTVSIVKKNKTTGASAVKSTAPRLKNENKAKTPAKISAKTIPTQSEGAEK